MTKVLEEFLKLKELDVLIHNYNETLVFLKDDILNELENTNQKQLSKLLGMNEPSFSLMIRFFKSLDSTGYKSTLSEFNILYDNTSYKLVKGQ